MLTPRHDPQMQLPQLLFAHWRRRIDHQVDRLRRLRKRDHLTEARRTSQNHHDAVEAERNPAMRRRAVLESIKEEPKPLLRLRIRHAQRPEDLGLYILPVNTNGSRTKLRPVQHNVVRERARRALIAGKPPSLNVFLM